MLFLIPIQLIINCSSSKIYFVDSIATIRKPATIQHKNNNVNVVDKFILNNIRLFMADFSLGNISSSRLASVMDSLSGQVRLSSSALLQSFDTAFLETLQFKAMFRSLKFRLFSLIISRYLVMIVTSFYCIYTIGAYIQYKG